MEKGLVGIHDAEKYYGKRKLNASKKTEKENDFMHNKDKNNPPVAFPEKPTPAYLRPDYPYQAIEEPINDLTTIQPTGVLYEIGCTSPGCSLCARTQGVNIPGLHEKMCADGCPSCKGKSFIVREVDMGKK